MTEHSIRHEVNGKRAGKGTPCRYGNRCTRVGCWYIHPPAQPPPPPPPPPPPRSSTPVPQAPVRTARPDGQSDRTATLGNLGGGRSSSARARSVTRVPPAPVRIAQTEGGGASSSSARPQVGVTLAEHVVDTFEIAADIHDQLRHGMLHHFNRYLRLHRLQGRLRQGSFQIYVHNSPDDPDANAVVEFVGVPGLIEAARAVLEQHLISFLQSPPHHAVPEVQLADEMREVVHVFVDNSNISIGCQFLPNGTRDFTQRLCIHKFAQAVIGARQVQRQVVVGSKPPRGHAVWQHWENAGYQVLVEWRDPHTNREQFVDARLVGEALMHVGHVDRQGGGRHVLALCTGDGNLEGQAPGTAGANFINLAQDVARRGWKVEVWCWRSTCNSAYRRLSEDPGLQVKLCFLDGLRSKITMTSRVAAPEDSLCVQCLSNIPTHAFQPCNHKILCEDCARIVMPHRGRPPLGCCFICREEWEAIVASPANPRF